MPTPAIDAAPAHAVSRVLILRSCRMPVFTDAMAWVRGRWPAARVDALSAPGWDAALLEAGVEGVVHYAGRSLSLLRDATRLWRLRGRYDLVVVPQMNDAGGHYANLYRAVLALGAPRVVVAPAGTPPVTLDRTAARWLALHTTFARLLLAVDVPWLLALMVVAWVRRRPAPSPGDRVRVLHIITTFGVGGAQVQLAELLQRTPAARYDVEVLVLGRQDGDFSRQWLDRDDIPFHYSSGWPRRALAALEVARLCRTRRYDLVHTWLFMANVIGATGARLAGVPRILGSVRNLSLWKRTWYARPWFRVADALATRIADQVTVNATPLVADHAHWTWTRPERLAVVPNGLDPERVLSATRHATDPRAFLRAHLGVEPETPVVGTVGRLAPEKDQATFLRAVAIVALERPTLRAIVVGDGALRADLVRLADALGLGGRIHFLGERTDSRRLIAGLDVFVLTSRIEGFPNVLLEAAFLGVPAIATAVGGASDVLDSTDLFSPGDDLQCATALARRLEFRDQARFHAAAVRRRAHEQFTADRSTARWLAIYDSLLSAKEKTRED